MTTRDYDYQLMISALADVTRRRDTNLENAEQAFQDSAARAAGELARAESDATAADRWAGAAAVQVLDVDREAARLWDQLRRVRGVTVRAVGELPEPAAVEALPREASPQVELPTAPDTSGPSPGRESARQLLARVAARIDDQINPPSRRPLPGWALAVLPVLGALLAAATGLLAAALVTVGDAGIPGGVLIRGLGWLGFLLAPSAGVPAAAMLAHQRLQARLDIGGIGLTLLGGMVAATLLSLSFASSH